MENEPYELEALLPRYALGEYSMLLLKEEQLPAFPLPLVIAPVCATCPSLELVMEEDEKQDPGFTLLLPSLLYVVVPLFLTTLETFNVPHLAPTIKPHWLP